VHARDAGDERRRPHELLAKASREAKTVSAAAPGRALGKVVAASVAAARGRVELADRLLTEATAELEASSIDLFAAVRASGPRRALGGRPGGSARRSRRLVVRRARRRPTRPLRPLSCPADREASKPPHVTDAPARASPPTQERRCRGAPRTARMVHSRARETDRGSNRTSWGFYRRTCAVSTPTSARKLPHGGADLPASETRSCASRCAPSTSSHACSATGDVAGAQPRLRAPQSSHPRARRERDLPRGARARRPAVLANVYLEGALLEVYPEITQSTDGCGASFASSRRPAACLAT